MSKLNPEHIKSVIEMINKAPFFVNMSMKVTKLGIGFAEVEVNITERHKNPFGGVHGGVYAAAIDTAAYWSAYGELPEENGLVSIDLKIDFLSPIPDQRVFVTGNRIKSGKSIYLVEARMLNENGKLLGHGTSKLMVSPNKQTIHDAARYIRAGRLPEKFLNQ